MLSVGPALNYQHEEAVASGFLLAGGVLLLGAMSPYYLLVGALLGALTVAMAMGKTSRSIEGLTFLVAGLGALAALLAAPGGIDGFGVAVGAAVALRSIYLAVGKLAPQR